jgi:hypothetical protein
MGFFRDIFNAFGLGSGDRGEGQAEASAEYYRQLAMLNPGFGMAHGFLTPPRARDGGEVSVVSTGGFIQEPAVTHGSH